MSAECRRSWLDGLLRAGAALAAGGIAAAAHASSFDGLPSLDVVHSDGRTASHLRVLPTSVDQAATHLLIVRRQLGGKADHTLVALGRFPMLKIIRTQLYAGDERIDGLRPYRCPEDAATAQPLGCRPVDVVLMVRAPDDGEPLKVSVTGELITPLVPFLVEGGHVEWNGGSGRDSELHRAK